MIELIPELLPTFDTFTDDTCFVDPSVLGITILAEYSIGVPS